MSTFNETITLTNYRDKQDVKRGLIPQAEVHSLTLDACVDTGAWNLVINEETRVKLGLELEGSVLSTLADGSTIRCGMTEGVELRWKDRQFILPVQVVPAAEEVLLGALALEALDVIADPVDECLKGRHGDTVVRLLR